jgi:predicted dehydrogenase
MTKQKSCSRREFIRRAAVAGSLFSVVPRHVVAGSGQTPPSGKIRVAAIGAAGRASANINGLAGAGAEIVALCDVDTRRTDAMRKKFPDAPFFTDHREMLDKLDSQIDGVTIGTPDHWHAALAIEVLKRGKHVQCEKPLAQTFGEVDQMIAATRGTKLVNQAMNQGHAFDTIRTFREWIEAGLIGTVKEAHFWAPASYSCMDQLDELAKTHEIPKELDWERWQGPVAPHRAYCPLYLPGRWRFWTDYGCSTLGDWACHLMDPIFWALDLGLPEAVRVDDWGDWDPAKHGATYPKGDVFTLSFPAKGGRGPLTVKWFDGPRYRSVPCPEGLASDQFAPRMEKYVNSGPSGEGGVIYGDKGAIVYGSHGAKNLRLLQGGKLVDTSDANKDLPVPRYPRVKGGSPYHEWLGAVKGEAPVGSDFAYAGNITQASLVALASLFDPGKRLEWDAAKREFKNSAAANARLRVKRLPGYGV